MRSALCIVLVAFSRFAAAICDANDASLWLPNPGDTFDSVLRPLGISAKEFREDNKDVIGDVDRIDYASTYCVHYITSLSKNYYTTSGIRFFSPFSDDYQKTVGTTTQTQTQTQTQTRSTKPEQSPTQAQPLDSSKALQDTQRNSTTGANLTAIPTETERPKTTTDSAATAAPQLSERKCCAQRDREVDLTNDFQTQAEEFCINHGIFNFYPGYILKNRTGNINVKVGEEDFIFSIEWVAACDRWQFQNGLQPAAYDKTITCLSVMSKNFSNCGDGKKSNGGYMDVGCLRYSSRAKGWALGGGSSD
ncbi:hypothetical protein BDP55DRAFT_760880 [Colletotrichum godetiae]|uniref:LysM domain-containing protein n=1 Tax=Colletotrichum godetiae TaxID=1209918 RepID=A0AAJ0EQJ2_9PEZI|nr:uncharacterized protein BDP55DRAFT_760880 [Colletotrichum godetiae]KAK1657634.1 hypothetical protein BDP55DRAFT_760880 [Colletotrichum godetiae]